MKKWVLISAIVITVGMILWCLCVFVPYSQVNKFRSEEDDWRIDYSTMDYGDFHIITYIKRNIWDDCISEIEIRKRNDTSISYGGSDGSGEKVILGKEGNLVSFRLIISNSLFSKTYRILFIDVRNIEEVDYIAGDVIVDEEGKYLASTENDEDWNNYVKDLFEQNEEAINSLFNVYNELK